MDESQILNLVKERLGIRTAVRDSYLTAIVQGVLKELQDEHGLVLEPTNAYHLMFVVDFSTWRYQSAANNETSFTGSPVSMPRHLQYRLHNLLLHVGSKRS